MPEARPESEHYRGGEEGDDDAGARVEKARLPKGEIHGHSECHIHETLARRPRSNTRSPDDQPNQKAGSEADCDSVAHIEESTPLVLRCFPANHGDDPSIGRFARARSVRRSVELSASRPTRAAPPLGKRPS